MCMKDLRGSAFRDFVTSGRHEGQSEVDFGLASTDHLKLCLPHETLDLFV